MALQARHSVCNIQALAVTWQALGAKQHNEAQQGRVVLKHGALRHGRARENALNNQRQEGRKIGMPRGTWVGFLEKGCRAYLNMTKQTFLAYTSIPIIHLLVYSCRQAAQTEMAAPLICYSCCACQRSVQHAIDPAALPSRAAAGWRGGGCLGGSQACLQPGDAARGSNRLGAFSWVRLRCSGPHNSRGMRRVPGRVPAATHSRPAAGCWAATRRRRLPCRGQQVHSCEQQAAGGCAQAAQRAVVLAWGRLHI